MQSSNETPSKSGKSSKVIPKGMQSSNKTPSKGGKSSEFVPKGMQSSDETPSKGDKDSEVVPKGIQSHEIGTLVFFLFFTITVLHHISCHHFIIIQCIPLPMSVREKKGSCSHRDTEKGGITILLVVYR
jgi:hypothetical protein